MIIPRSLVKQLKCERKEIWAHFEHFASLFRFHIKVFQRQNYVSQIMFICSKSKNMSGDDANLQIWEIKQCMLVRTCCVNVIVFKPTDAGLLLFPTLSSNADVHDLQAILSAMIWWMFWWKLLDRCWSWKCQQDETLTDPPTHSKYFVIFIYFSIQKIGLSCYKDTNPFTRSTSNWAKLGLWSKLMFKP